MSLFALPPKLPHTDIDLDLFMHNPEGAPVSRPRRSLPAEWAPQSGVQLTWPHAATDWAPMLGAITDTYVRLAYEIATREVLLIVCPDVASVRSLLEEKLPRRATDNIIYAECDTNDTWARDHAFLTLLGTGGAELLDLCFNGWGGKFRADLDNGINRRLFDMGLLKGSYTDLLDFELEGGAIESDGMGTILTTASVLLNENRNAGTDHGEMAMGARLLDVLAAERIIFLHSGHLEGDDTDGHIDTLARFCPDDTIAYVKCNDESDTHFADFQKMEQELRTLTTAEGKPYNLVPLPMPHPVFDEDGQRLPATYANFLVLNGAVLCPTYKQPELDEQAMKTLAAVFPKRDIVGVDATALISQHGSIHCAAMQYPKGVIRKNNDN